MKSVKASPNSKTVRRVSFSLRYKLLVILTLLPLLALGLYLRVATNLFREDKLPYVKDSGVAVARSVASELRLETDSFVNAIRPVIEGFDADQKAFSPEAQQLFSSFSRIVGLVLYQGSIDGTYTKLGELGNSSEASRVFLGDQNSLERMRQIAASQGLVIQLPQAKELGGSVLIASRLGKTSDMSHMVFIGLYTAPGLIEAFNSRYRSYKLFLIDRQGGIAMRTQALTGTPLERQKLEGFFSSIMSEKLPDGSLDLKTSEGRELLASYASVGDSFRVVSVVDKEEALRAVNQLIAKSVLFFIALIAATVLISVFASIQLTSTLRDLYEATRKIAAGKFDVRVRSNSTDEIGGLADGFNVMAGEVSRLMSETAEKARMENELATVRTVQETLFPAAESQFGRLRIVGHFEPASECGGDWWNYSRVGDKIYLWIGDATGHGAPAALITSAARSAAAVIEGLDGMSPGRALEILNRAIHETSKGQINMTFFLAAIDEKAGKMVYANASHDPPYLIRKPQGRALSKRDLTPLMEVNGPRLGERLGSTYEEVEVDLQAGDSIVFYTDGIIDLQDMSGNRWGERTFLKHLVDVSSGQHHVQEKMSYLKRTIGQYRGEAALLDDITLFMVEIEEAA